MSDSQRDPLNLFLLEAGSIPLFVLLKVIDNNFCIIKKKIQERVHLAIRAATTGSGSALLKVLRDTGWERKTRETIPHVYTPAHKWKRNKRNYEKH